MITISSAADVVVGRRDSTLRRIVKTGELIEGNIAFPLRLRVGGGKRQQRRPLRAKRPRARQAVADVAGAVGVEIVERRRRLVGERRAKLFPVPRPVDLVD